MVDVRGDVLRPPHGTTPAAVKSNIKSEMRSFKSNENIQTLVKVLRIQACRYSKQSYIIHVIKTLDKIGKTTWATHVKTYCSVLDLGMRGYHKMWKIKNNSHFLYQKGLKIVAYNVDAQI